MEGWGRVRGTEPGGVGTGSEHAQWGGGGAVEGRCGVMGVRPPSHRNSGRRKDAWEDGRWHRCGQR